MSTGSIATAILTGGSGQAIGSLVGPGVDAGKGIWNYFSQKRDYIKSLRQNYEELDKEAGYLSAREEDVNNKIAGEKVLKEPTHECVRWLEEVKKTKKSVEKLVGRYRELESCNALRGPRKLGTRLNLSKEIEKTTPSVINLRNYRFFKDEFLTERQTVLVEKRPTRNIKDVPSLYEHVETLLKYLQDGLQKIGIWGMPGVGKTTILENLNNEVDKLQKFDIVLWVTVLKDGSIHQIQQAILKRLRVEGIMDEVEARNVIRNKLERKNFLLLLDQVSSVISLPHLGIHLDESGSRRTVVVMTTREKSICDRMDTDDEIEVEGLSSNDAFKLFRDVVGEAMDNRQIRRIAERVLKQCGTLPQVIEAIGMQLKGERHEDVWRSTLSRLRSPNMKPLEGMDDLFNTFKILYEGLKEKNLKHCLLYGASFPEDYEIYPDYLIECWKAEGLIGVDETLQKTREDGRTELKRFIEKCLFVRCGSTTYVKMPSIFRYTARKMAHEENFGLLVSDSEELARVEKWRNAKVISLMDSRLDALPHKPECCMISTLSLQKNENLGTIPVSFFDYMLSLKILNLSGTYIKTLPPSISKLTKLRGVYLNDCRRLVCLPRNIEHLQNLEILDISRTGIIGLPPVIRELTCLRCLRLSFRSVEDHQNHAVANHHQINVVANGIDVTAPTIYQHHQLEELSIDVGPNEPRWSKIAPVIVRELTKLGNLSSLSYYFPTIKDLAEFVHNSISWRNENLRSFNFHVGSYEADNMPPVDLSKCTGQRYLQYVGGEDIPSVIKEVLRRSCAFKITGHQNITNISHFGNNELADLEICQVEGCTTMTNIFESHMVGTPIFKWLRELHICNVQLLSDIFQGSIVEGSFAKLATLSLVDCPNMIKVFSWDMATQLCELQHLKVENCPQVTNIIEVHAQTSGACAFPKLKTLELVKLEALVSIHSEWRDLQEIKIIECDNLINLCFGTTNAMKMRQIHCSEAWWGALNWSNDVKTHLRESCCFVQV